MLLAWFSADGEADYRTCSKGPTGGFGHLREYNFTVSLSRVSFCVQRFVLFNQVFFSFLYVVVSFLQKKILCFGIFV